MNHENPLHANIALLHAKAAEEARATATVPETLTREQAAERLRSLDFSRDAAAIALNDARSYLAGLETSDDDGAPPILAILRAYVAGLDAKPCPSRWIGLACEKRGKHDTHGSLDGLDMWTNEAAERDAARIATEDALPESLKSAAAPIAFDPTCATCTGEGPAEDDKEHEAAHRAVQRMGHAPKPTTPHDTLKAIAALVRSLPVGSRTRAVAALSFVRIGGEDLAIFECIRGALEAPEDRVVIRPEYAIHAVESEVDGLRVTAQYDRPLTDDERAELAANGAT